MAKRVHRPREDAEFNFILNAVQPGVRRQLREGRRLDLGERAGHVCSLPGAQHHWPVRVHGELGAEAVPLRLCAVELSTGDALALYRSLGGG